MNSLQGKPRSGGSPKGRSPFGESSLPLSFEGEGDKGGEVVPHLHHQIVLGDSRGMAEVGDGSVHLVVTSPPYWQLKDYGSPDQIGFHNTYEEYIAELDRVWRECFRALAPGCRLCINIGDQFARRLVYGRYKVIPIRADIIRCCEALGLDYMGAIVWQKKTTMNTSGGAVVMGSYPYPRNGIVEIDYEHILLFKKPGKPPRVSREIKEASRLSKREWKKLFSGHWRFGGKRQAGHLAMFPEELPRRLIRMFTFVGETVLDPFLGSGTTVLAAHRLGRNAIGYEINRDFLPIIREKLKPIIEVARHPSSKRRATLEVVEQPGPSAPSQHLPPVSATAQPQPQVDPRKLGLSVISKQARPQRLPRVKEVVDAQRLRLDTGEVVRLLGVEVPPQQVEAARDYLEQYVRGKEVIVESDDVGQAGEIAAYLYLKNRIFVNGYLVRSGLALPSPQPHRLQKRFQRYVAEAKRRVKK